MAPSIVQMRNAVKTTAAPVKQQQPKTRRSFFDFSLPNTTTTMRRSSRRTATTNSPTSAADDSAANVVSDDVIENEQQPPAQDRMPEISLKPQPDVAAFLVKLYNMVNDRNSNDLIRWADDGCSFLVLKQEEFSHQVLPKFFKHSNFSSFVRQLNMYGFHKVPHVLSGIAKGDEQEQFEFKHDRFRRGHPELLSQLKRRTNKSAILLASAAQASNAHTTSDGSGPAMGLNIGAQATRADLTNIKQILTELSQIRRSQSLIQQEITKLKDENQSLWLEAVHQQQRHQQQEAMIERILRFLASVYSKEKIQGLKGNVVGPTATIANERKRRKLLLENSPSPTTAVFENAVNNSTAAGATTAGSAGYFDFLPALGSTSNAIPGINATGATLGSSVAENKRSSGLTELADDDDPVLDVHGQLMELMKPVSDTSNTYTSSMALIPTNIGTSKTAILPPGLSRPSPQPTTTDRTKTLTSLNNNIESLQSNLDQLTSSLGLTEEELRKLDTMDVDDFLQDYLDYDKMSSNDGAAAATSKDAEAEYTVTSPTPSADML